MSETNEIIKFENVNVTFKQKRKKFDAVKNVSLSVKEGEIVGIIGSSGAGKSTLLRTVNALQKVDSGKVYVDGKDIAGLRYKEVKALRNDIGMIFQHFNLVRSRDVYKNIEFVLRENGKSKKQAEERINELLKYVGLEEKKHEYPAHLSGGQKQRVAIARALANNARILLCDEPTSALDAETTDNVLSLIKQINKELKVTVLLITHELEVAKKICDRVVVMDDGKIIEEGDVYETFTKPATEFTESLIGKENDFKIPGNVLEHVKGRVVKIEYFEEEGERALISDVIQKFDVKLNILHGRIEFIKDKPLGVLIVSIDGDKAETDKAIEYISGKAGRIEVIRNV